MNPFYNATGNPAPGSGGLSALARAEYAAIATGFSKLPGVLTGNAGKLVVVNNTEDGLTTSNVIFPGPSGPYLPIVGGTVTGATTLSGAGTALTVSNNATIAGTLTALGAAVAPSFASAAGASLTISPGGNGHTITFGDPSYGIGSIGTMTMSAGAMGMNIQGYIQGQKFTTGVNSFDPASSALANIFFYGGNVSGTVVGAGSWGGAGISNDTADFSGANDKTAKLWELQYNVSGGAKGGRIGLWAQINPSNLSNPIEIVPINSQITANNAMGGSFLQPLATAVVVGSGATNVGNTLNEFDYGSAANVVGIKGGLLINLIADLYQGLAADAGLFFSSSHTASSGSAGMAAAIALGNTLGGFPLGTNGWVLTVLPQVANAGSGKNAQFIRPVATGGIGLQYINYTIESGSSFVSAGFSIDGTGQAFAAQGLVLGRSGASYTVDVPSTFAVSSIAVNNSGNPAVSAGSSSSNYYPGEVIFGPSRSQYEITECQLLSAAITSGGTGGTPGAAVVTLSGGAGVAATVNVTIGAGGNITAVNSVATAGTYTTLPANLNAEPVTGAGLSGATLAVGMGAKTVIVLVPDVFATNVTAITAVGGSGTGLTLTGTNQTRNGLSIMPTAGGLIGFYGTAPLAKQTGVAVTAAAIHAALTSLGLIAP